LGRGRGVKTYSWTLVAVAAIFWKRKVTFPLSLHLYPILNERGCLGAGYLWFLSLF